MLEPEATPAEEANLGELHTPVRPPALQVIETVDRLQSALASPTTAWQSLALLLHVRDRIPAAAFTDIAGCCVESNPLRSYAERLYSIYEAESWPIELFAVAADPRMSGQPSYREFIAKASAFTCTYSGGAAARLLLNLTNAEQELDQALVQDICRREHDILGLPQTTRPRFAELRELCESPASAPADSASIISHIESTTDSEYICPALPLIAARADTLRADGLLDDYVRRSTAHALTFEDPPEFLELLWWAVQDKLAEDCRLSVLTDLTRHYREQYGTRRAMGFLARSEGAAVLDAQFTAALLG